MRLVIPFLAAILFSGCASPRVESHIQPVSLGETRGELSDASIHLSKLQKEVLDVEQTGAQPHDKRIAAALGEAGLVGNRLGSATAKLDAAQKQIDDQTAKINVIVTDYNSLQFKYQAAVKMLWKWRLIAIGLAVATALFFIFRTWLKVQFPFLPI